MMKRRIFILCFVLLVGSWASWVSAAQRISLILDWFPNVDHLPIYEARRQGFFTDAGLEVKIISPSETTDAIKLVASGKVDIAVSYQPQTIIAAARGLPVVVIGRLIEHPLTTLMFLKDRGIEVPADLAGKKIGYTVPGLMDVLLQAFAAINGIEKYEAVNVGFAIVQSLTAGKVDAVMGPFKTYETVELAHRGYKAGYFELEKWGIPDYDELIFLTSRKNLENNHTAMAAFRRAIGRAIEKMRQNPSAALQHYFKQVPEADRRTETEALRLTLPYYATHQKLDRERWQRFVDFALRYGLIEKKVDVKSVLWTPEK